MFGNQTIGKIYKLQSIQVVLDFAGVPSKDITASAQLMK